MAGRNYRLGRRQDAVERTRASILAAARELLASGERGWSAGAVARRAGVSRLTIYNQFGSKDGLLVELAAATGRGSTPGGPEPSDPRDQLRLRIATSCARWSVDPALFRGLLASGNLEVASPAEDRALAERLAAAEQLRPGCSLKEAEDVIGGIASFTMFDRLYKDGRRTTSAVTDILMRLASTLLSSERASPGWPGSPRT
jgi:AcrR family transcriptional regulator